MTRPSPPAPEDLRPLTSLRFVAALWVVLFDYWPLLAARRPAPLERGRLGVELFFVLSGFILCHVHLQPFGEGRLRPRDFLWSRLARVYPTHLATLAGFGGLALLATALGSPSGENVLRWSSLPGELTLTHAWGFAPAAGWNHPSWSISAEWFAYLAFPVFAAAAWRLRRRPLLATAGTAAAALLLYAAFQRVEGFPLTLATTRFGWLRITPCFAYGCALHLMWRAWRGRVGPERRRLVLAAAAGATALLAAAATFGAPDGAVVLAAGALILALAFLPAAGSRLMGGRALVHLGEASFALYMVAVPWQVTYQNLAAKLLHLEGDLLPPVVWAGLVAGLLPVALGVHHLIERPARAWMRRRGAPFAGRRPALRERPEGVEPRFVRER